MSHQTNEKPDFGTLPLNLSSQVIPDTEINESGDGTDLKHPTNEWLKTGIQIVTRADRPTPEAMALDQVQIAFAQPKNTLLCVAALESALDRKVAQKTPKGHSKASDLYANLQASYDGLRLAHSREIRPLLVVIERFGANLERTPPKQPRPPGLRIGRKLAAQFGKDYKDPYTAAPYAGPLERVLKDLTRHLETETPESAAASTMQHYDEVIGAFKRTQLSCEGPVVTASMKALGRIVGNPGQNNLG